MESAPVYDRAPCKSHESDDDESPVREIIPLPGQQVRIRVPNGKRITRAYLLVAKTEAPYRELTGQIELQMPLPSIKLYEVVALDFAM